MQILSLDISTKTGWSLAKKGRLLKYGLIETQVSNYKGEIKSYKDYPKEYPHNFIDAARDLTRQIDELISGTKPDCIVIEETNKAKARFSQKILEFTHFSVINLLITKYPDIQLKYLTTKCWRDSTKCYLKDWPEYSKWNNKVGRLKKKAKPTKSGAMVAKLDGKIVTRVDQKRLSIILANDHFGLDIDDDNIADSLNMLRAALELRLFE